jgi:anti-anti-sigma factor
MSQHYVLTGNALSVFKDPKFDDPEFKAALEALTEAPSAALVLDMSRVKYISSPEIGLLVKTYKDAKKAGKHIKLTVSPEVFMVLQLVQMDKMMDLVVARGGRTDAIEKRGDDAFDKHDYRHAVTEYEKLLSFGQMTPRVRFRLAYACAAVGNNAEAVKHYDELLKTDSRSWIVQLNRASALVGAGRTDDAAKALAAAKTSGAPRLHAAIAEGAIALATGDAATASSAFDRALGIDPAHPSALLGRGSVFLASGTGDRAAARKALEAAGKTAGSVSVAARRNLALIDLTDSDDARRDGARKALAALARETGDTALQKLASAT